MDEEHAAIPESTPRKRAHGRQRVAIKVIRIQGEAALVEYADAGLPLRVTLPADRIAGGTAEPEDLAAGIPYGLEWEKAATGHVTPQDIARSLRNAGIWTAEDLQSHAQAALGALQAAYLVDLSALMRFAAESGKED